MPRGDFYRIQAAAAEACAAKVTSAEIKRQYLELADRWRDLARQADEHEALAKAGKRLRPDG